MSVRIAVPRPRKYSPDQCFHYGDERICFEISTRRSQKSKVLIKVHPDCRVQVAAPENSSDEEVLGAVKKRGRWIWQQLRDFRAQQEHLTERQYISGESHYYLGKQYMLKILVEPQDKPRVKMLRGKLEITVRENNPERIRVLLNEWYKDRAKEVFARRLEEMLVQALWVSERPPLRVQTMQTQWGSCSPLGRITLNPHLVKAPRESIDYVILHELCHLAEHNHSEQFYRLMKQVMPHWEKVKMHLDSMAAALLNGSHRA